MLLSRVTGGHCAALMSRPGVLKPRAAPRRQTARYRRARRTGRGAPEKRFSRNGLKSASIHGAAALEAQGPRGFFCFFFPPGETAGELKPGTACASACVPVGGRARRRRSEAARRACSAARGLGGLNPAAALAHTHAHTRCDRGLFLTRTQ